MLFYSLAPGCVDGALLLLVLLLDGLLLVVDSLIAIAASTI
jgi:hypothetical protein